MATPTEDAEKLINRLDGLWYDIERLRRPVAKQVVNRAYRLYSAAMYGEDKAFGIRNLTEGDYWRHLADDIGQYHGCALTEAEIEAKYEKFKVKS